MSLLDGHPLAISLAAQFAGAQHQSIAAILVDLREAASPRPVLDGAWHSLTRHQQVFLGGLSLVEGPSIRWVDARAIARVATAADGMDDTEEFVDDVEVLVRLSVVDARPGKWLRLHPLVREYAAARLAELPGQLIELLREAAV